MRRYAATISVLCTAASLATAAEEPEKMGDDMAARVRQKNAMTTEEFAEYLPYIHPVVHEPIPEGVSQNIPPELGNRALAVLGVVDVTATPFAADPTGRTDATATIRRAVDFARDRQMVLFFPPGTYRITDTIECRQQLTVRGNGRLSAAPNFPCALVGSALPGNRSVLFLAPRSPGFSDPDRRKIVVHFVNCNAGYGGGNFAGGPLPPQANISYNQVFAGIDIVIGEDNPGAVGIRMQAAEGSTIQDVTIDATHGHTGMLGAAGSGGSHHNITVRGGRIGIDTRGFPPEFAPDRTGTQPTPTMVHVTLTGQTEVPLVAKPRGPLVAVGWRIEFAGPGPAIRTERDFASSPFNGGLALIDSVIRFAGPDPATLAIAAEKSFFLENVYLERAEAVAPDVPGNPDGWLRVDQLAYPIRPPPFRDMDLSEVVVIDGRRSREPYVRASAGPSPPAGLRARHIWQAGFPSWQTPGAVNVKSPPYSAAGDSVTDDTAALQKAIDENEVVLLPKGYYRVSETLRLRPSTKLVGVAHHLSVIMARPPYGRPGPPTDPWPLVETADAPDADTVIAFVGILLADEAPAAEADRLGGILPCYALSWRSGGSSVVRSPQIARGHLDGFPLRAPTDTAKLTYDAPLVRISGNGGGRWYNFFTHGLMGETDRYRHILVDNATGPLAFYHLHAQHADSFAQCEIRNSRDVRIYGVKSEYQTRFLVARNSAGIRIYGHGGNATAFRGSGHYLFADCTDFLISNLCDQFDLRRSEPRRMPYRKYPAEPVTEYAPLVITDGDTTEAVPWNERPVLWRRTP